jgi:hypothetical protein
MELLTYKDPQRLKNVILDLAQKERQVIYGQQSVNVQLPPRFRRETKDFDILTKKPKQSAEKLVKQLEKEYGKGSFRVEPARYGKTFKVKDKEGKTVADYTLTTKKPKTKEVWGVKYSNIDYQKGKLKKILKDEAYKFRHDKDMDTLKRIKEGGVKKW